MDVFLINKKRFLMLSLLVLFFCQNMISQNNESRSLWLSKLEKIAFPVLSNLAKDSLNIKMPLYKHRENQCLEAFGRTFCGLSRWLNLKDNSDEDSLRECYRQLVIRCIENGFNPDAKDHFNFNMGNQPLVDAAYLAQGLLRCPRVWNLLDEDLQHDIIAEFEGLRRIEPYGNNWLLFSSMLEAFLYKVTGDFDSDRLTNGVLSFIYGFYTGDGLYGDGNDFVYNYYNSYVIHPMLMDILLLIQDMEEELKDCLHLERIRYGRYVQLLERQIMPDGSMPVYGRTVTCRLGLLNAMAEYVCIVDSVPLLPMGQIRSAMTAALRRHLTDDDFDQSGFMHVGFKNDQSRLAENYISMGSSYHCATFFLPLGLPLTHPFWTDIDREWSACKIYKGQDIIDYDVAYIEPRTIGSIMKHCYYRYKNLGDWQKSRLSFLGIIVFSLSLIGLVTILTIIIKSVICLKRIWK